MRNKRLFYCFFLLLIPFLCIAEEKSYYLDKIVVKDTFPVKSTFYSGFNTIITREDIDRSKALTLFELLEMESAISLRSNTGSDRFTSIDLRGMGETSSSNVVVVLDGIVLNQIDMSGQGLNDISLEIIDSIEIIRGSGAVMHGGGAVSGVIVIKTIVPQKNHFLFDFNIGSYGKSEKSALITHKSKIQSVSVNALLNKNHGYRKNSFYNKGCVDIAYNNKWIDSFNFGFKGKILRDEYGLPGGISLSYLKDKNIRKKSFFSNDNGDTSKEEYLVFAEKDFNKAGKINFTRSYFFKENEYLLGYSPLIGKNEQINRISIVSKDLKIAYLNKFGFLFLNSGFDWLFDDYVRRSENQSLRINGQIESKDFFVESGIKKNVYKLNAGFRFSDSSARFREDLLEDEKAYAGEVIRTRYSNTAYEAGFTYYFEPVDFFCLVSRTYRIPNIDELGFSSGKIKKQTSLNYEAGMRYNSGSSLKSEISFFNLVTKNEIYYGEDQKGHKINRNYEGNTLRRGINADIKLILMEKIFLKFSGSFICAEFEDTGFEIPLVSEKEFAIYAEYEIFNALFLSGQFLYNSKKRQGGDLKKERAIIPSYNIFNFGISYKTNHYTFYFKVKNLFNELYTTACYENLCYPMDEQSFTFGLKMEF